MKTLTALLCSFAILFGAFTDTAHASPTPNVERIAGKNRYETAAKISAKHFTRANTSRIYLVRGDVLADGLVAGTLPGGPVLLTRTDSIPGTTMREIERLGHPPVVVIGAKSVVSDSVARQASKGKPFTRLAGKSRIGTSVAVSRWAYPNGSTTVYLADAYGANGAGSPDAVAGGTLQGGPILYVDPKTGPSATVRAEIQRLGATNVVGLGSFDFRYPTTATLGGRNRFATSAVIARHVFDSPRKVYLANAHTFADAVAAGTLDDGPILLNPAQNLRQEFCDYLAESKPSQIVALGGDLAISDEVLKAASMCATNNFQKPASTTSEKNLYVLAHPDDEWQIWGHLEQARKDDDHPVFYIATQGEETLRCRTSRWTSSCTDRRLDSWFGFFRSMGYDAPNRKQLSSIEVLGSGLSRIDNGKTVPVSPQLHYFTGKDATWIVTDLGDGDLTEHELAWAIGAIHANASAMKMPDLPWGDLVSNYYNPSPMAGFYYPQSDHYATYVAVEKNHHGFARAYQATFGGETNVTVSQSETTRAWARKGAHRIHYGWIGMWDLGTTNATSLFAQQQSYRTVK